MDEINKIVSDDNKIILTGFVEGNALEELYSNAYIYTLPSDLEGMPLSLLEAMSYGNCCLTSDIPECADVIEDMGVTFKRSDIGALKEALQRLCDNENVVNEYKAVVRDRICEKYNWDDITERTIELYGK